MNATEELQYIDSYDKIDAVLERVASIREEPENILELLLIFMEEFISLWQRFWRKSWKNLILCL